jgi:hypothetical protein
MNARRRLGMVAVGLGIGAAVASTPGMASADTPATDPFSWLAGLDPGDLSAAALPAASPFDLDISVDGFTLLDLGTTASATSGMGDIAIAYGPDSTAIAEGGFGDYALATAGATATAGDPDPGATGNNFDFASAGGIGSNALAGNNPDLCLPVGLTCAGDSSFDYASATSATGTGADASAGFNGNFDSASAFGQSAVAGAGVSGSATPANFDSADVWGNVNTPTLDEAVAGSGGVPFVGGSSDTAFVVDPLGTVGSTAFAGHGFNFDLAGVFGDNLNAVANTANNLVDILPSL